MISYNTVEKYSKFVEYKEAEINLVKFLVERYKPEYFIIVNEPVTMRREQV